MYDIITLGSANVDTLVKTKSEVNKHEHHVDIAYHLGEKVLIDDLFFTTGGGGTNSAVAFSRLGLKTGYIGAVGDDQNGKLILSELKDEKVDFLGKIKKGKTGYSVILTGGGDRTILAYKGINNSLSKKDINIKKLKSDWLYACTMLDESLATSLEIIEHLKKSGTKIAFNISLYLAKQGIHALSSMLKYIDIIILNKEEAMTLTRKIKIEDIFKEFHKHTDALVVVTNGSSDVFAYYEGQIFIKRIEPIKAVDSTGAGDAFACGFIYGIMKGRSIPDSLELGHKEASSVLGHIGAKNNLLRKL